MRGDKREGEMELVQHAWVNTQNGDGVNIEMEGSCFRNVTDFQLRGLMCAAVTWGRGLSHSRTVRFHCWAVNAFWVSGTIVRPGEANHTVLEWAGRIKLTKAPLHYLATLGKKKKKKSTISVKL